MSRSPIGRLAVSLLLIGLLAVITVPVSAGSGDNLVLGQFNTAQTDKTTVWANSPNWAFRIKNVRPGAAALTLENDGVSPPLLVNSQGMVDNLNVDMLDGKHMPQIRPRQEWCAIADIPASTNWSCTRTVDVPTGGGTLVVTGTADFLNADTDPVWVQCYVEINSVQIAHSLHTTHIGADENGICTTEAYKDVSAGSYNVSFGTNLNNPIDMNGGAAAFSVMVIPG